MFTCRQLYNLSTNFCQDSNTEVQGAEISFDSNMQRSTVYIKLSKPVPDLGLQLGSHWDQRQVLFGSNEKHIVAKPVWKKLSSSLKIDTSSVSTHCLPYKSWHKKTYILALTGGILLFWFWCHTGSYWDWRLEVEWKININLSATFNPDIFINFIYLILG